VHGRDSRSRSSRSAPQNGKAAEQETPTGYVLPDDKNHTLEFRLVVTLELTPYEPNEVAIFFAEGTGYAAWKSEAHLRELSRLDMVTPLLKHVVR